MKPGTMQAGVHEMIGGWLAERIAKQQAFAVPDAPGWVLGNGSAVAQIEVADVDDGDEAHVIVRCVVAEIEREKGREELFGWLLATNLGTRFASLAFVPGQSLVVAQATLLGSTCDLKELAMALSEVSGLADAIDDDIVKAYGGKRGVDLFGGARS